MSKYLKKNNNINIIYMVVKIVLLITGQKKRLELSSKIKNIITPAQGRNYEITVVLSLSKTSSFTNSCKYESNHTFNTCDINKELSKIPLSY